MKRTILPTLNRGDKIALISSARKVSRAELEPAVYIINEWGLNINYGEHLYHEDNQFAGTIEERRHDFQTAIDDESIKAILFVRGGYGSVQIVDLIDWSQFVKKPKWIIGFSDITVFHSHIHQNFGIPTLHAAMPITLQKNTKSSLENLRKVLFGEKVSYQIEAHTFNRKGVAEAEIVGGNLSILYSLLGSKSQIDTEGKILFIEDLDEYLYHIDRMMQALKRAGMLKNLAGLIIGGMSDMNDNTIAYGKTAEEIIHDIVAKYDYPLAFGFPAGHQSDNQPLVLGANYAINITTTHVILEHKS